jgi:mannose-6-phosphate isomerase-like protein (cupin superfamily)
VDNLPRASGTAGSGDALVSGHKATNWFSGETLTFRRTSVETAGELVELDLELRPLGAPGGLPHRHVVAEHFEFAHGALCAFIAGRRPRIVRAGETIDVPPNRWHYILALRRSRARVLISPGMHFDELLLVWAAVGRGDLRPATLRRLGPLLREHGCV